jgi:signal transduction histidine kinase
MHVPSTENEMTDAERVLNLLIHDLRTPLGVAHGYLRLIREQRLTTPDDRDRALVSTQQALGRISRLCEDASGFLAEPAGVAPVRASIALLVERVAAQLSGHGVATTTTAVAGPATMVVGAGVDRLADAVTTVLRAMTRNAPGGVRVETSGAELRFIAGADGSPGPFDPWRGNGLAVPLACRLIASVGGRVGDAAGAPAIAFPVEMASE